MKSWQALFISLLLHAAIALCLLIQNSIKKSEKDALELEILPHAKMRIQSGTEASSNGASLKQGDRTRKNQNRNSRTQKKANLDKLIGQTSNSALPSESFAASALPREGVVGSARLGKSGGVPTSRAPLQEGRDGAWDEGGYTTDDNPEAAWGAGSGTFGRIQDLVLMSKFQHKVDALLFYPSVLARRDISGIVNSRVVLNEAGDCDWHRTKVNAANPYLRVYILHLLKKVCSENYKKYTHGKKMTNIDMSFTFVISEDRTSKELIAKNQSVVGNVLMFYRHRRDSVAQWNLGPFTGVFPIPWVMLDYEWVEENFETYVNKKDPLGDFR